MGNDVVFYDGGVDESFDDAYLKFIETIEDNKRKDDHAYSE